MLTVFVGLLASTGLRSGEARRLDRADVDLVEGVLHIRKGIVKLAAGWVA